MTARCGSTEPHGAHTGFAFAPHSRTTWCAGNLNVITGRPAPAHTHGWAPHARCVACVGPVPEGEARALDGNR